MWCPGRHHYYGPLRLPLTARLFPCVGYRWACFPGRRPGAEEGASPVPTTPFRPFHAPCAGGFVRTRSRIFGAVRGLRPPFIGSAPPWPRSRGGLSDDAAGFAPCCGPVGCTASTTRRCRSASTPGSRPAPGAVLPGTLASPRTGLAPAGCRELVARLRRLPPPFSLAPELLDARGVQKFRRRTPSPSDG